MMKKSLLALWLALLLSACTPPTQMAEVRDAERACQVYGGVSYIYNIAHYSERTSYTVTCTDGTEISRHISTRN